MAKNTINTKDKNSLIMACVLVVMIVLAVIFFNVSRTLPMIYMLIGIEALEILYVLPAVCKTYYHLYGSDAGFSAYIPYVNIISIFTKTLAIAAIVMAVITGIIAFLAFAPMFWVTISTLSFFADVQYRAFGWFIICLIVWSIVIGIGYIQVLRDVLDMKQEFTRSRGTKLEFANFALLLLPVARCFVLFNMLNTMKQLVAAGYERGKDYSELDITETEEDEE